MLNTRYRLVGPYSIEPMQVCEKLEHDTVVVRPTYMSICCADQRYWQSKRSAVAMRNKLPMALIHEAIGEVIFDATKKYRTGQRVVMLPNNPLLKDDVISENYLLSSQFCGSGYDGFMQELCFLPTSRVVPLPDTINDEIGAFIELITVAWHAINRFQMLSHDKCSTIGIWGDGNLGYIVALLLRAKFPDSKIIIYGRNQNKLANFSFADKTIIAYDAQDLVPVDHAFECCGAEGSTSAISQIIDSINPEGTISLLGVSEAPIPIFTRLVLEKGLRLIGSSRSCGCDFEHVVNFLQDNDKVLRYLSVLVNEIIEIKSVADISRAFSIDANKESGKTIIKWEL